MDLIVGGLIVGIGIALIVVIITDYIINQVMFRHMYGSMWRPVIPFVLVVLSCVAWYLILHGKINMSGLQKNNLLATVAAFGGGFISVTISTMKQVRGEKYVIALRENMARCNQPLNDFAGFDEDEEETNDE